MLMLSVPGRLQISFPHPDFFSIKRCRSLESKRESIEPRCLSSCHVVQEVVRSQNQDLARGVVANLGEVVVSFIP